MRAQLPARGRVLNPSMSSSQRGSLAWLALVSLTSFVWLAPLTGCKGGTSDAGPTDAGPDVTAIAHATCDAYIACMQKISPTTAADLTKEFGPNGGCFGQGRDEVCGSNCAAESVSALCDRDGAAPPGEGGIVPTEGGGGGDASGARVTLSGKLVDLSTKKAIGGATVQALGQGTTQANGTFAVDFSPGVPFRFQATTSGYWARSGQQLSAPIGVDLGTVDLVSDSTGSLLTQALPGYSATGGIVAVEIVARSSCASEAGATIAVSGGGAAKIIYTNSGFPDAATTSAQAGSLPHAFVYNATAGADLTVSVAHPTCTPAAFPVTVTETGGTITYVSAIATTAAGKSLSTLRVFLK